MKEKRGTVMQLNLHKKWLVERQAYKFFLIGFYLFLLSSLLWSRPILAYEFDDVLQSFERDFGRENPVKSKGRFASIIKEISSMEIGQEIAVVFKQRGDVKHEFFIEDMKRYNLTDELRIAGYEYLLKQLRLIENDYSLKDILFDAYDSIYGFYRPTNKDLVVMEGTSNQIAKTILFHELVHAAQDSTIDLNQYFERYGGNLDSSLAASALIEGQASAAEVIMRIERNLQSGTRKEILATILAQMKDDLHYQYKEEDFLSTLNTFPYFYGLKFVLRRYLNETENFTKMFEKVPASTEQILHPEKFDRNERPVLTKLQQDKEAISALPGVKLLLDTTLGEYFIRETFSHILSTKTDRNRSAASGWRGDGMFVLQSNRKLFFVWDTEWDSRKDAKEFYKRYVDFSKKRFNLKKSRRSGFFDATLSADHTKVFLKRDGKRVIIVEGDVPPAALDSLTIFF